MVFAYDDSGRLLLIQEKGSGLWGAPGGIVEPLELPADAAVRETRMLAPRLRNSIGVVQ
jgi:8-oxo-dGTP pyrophosphatase MutT (NUDIX family)